MADEKIQSDDSSYPIISSYGLLWERDKVDWTKGAQAGEMWGSPYLRVSTKEMTKGTPQFNLEQENKVNFANQVGVYILYNGEEIVYVGRALLSKESNLYSRLSYATYENSHSKQGLWNKFSWFGFCPVVRDPVDRNKKTISRSISSPTYSSELVVCVLEAVLIAAPAYPYPFNGQVGNFGDGNAYGQWGDYEYVQVK